MNRKTTPNAFPFVPSKSFLVSVLWLLITVGVAPPAFSQVTPPDADADGLPDAMEQTLGSDPNDADSDDDGLADGAETMPGTDTDGDGFANILDPDADNDGLADGTEAGAGCAGNGTNRATGRCVADADAGATKTDPLDRDSDNGGVSDGGEDANLDGKVDAGEHDPNNPNDDNTIPDADRDGLPDAEETRLGSDPQDADSDDDGLLDGQEPDPAVDTDRDGRRNLLDPDSDNDGLADGTEAGKDCGNAATDAAAGRCVADNDMGATRTSPIARDTDKGGASDGAEDSNRNGKFEQAAKESDPGNAADDAANTDTDKDGLSDDQELAIGSNANDADSDDDGLLDGQEPDPAVDTDRDGLRNVIDPDSDNDGLADGTEAGKDCGNAASNAAAKVCVADTDLGQTTSSAVNADSDGGGARDGAEDANLDGKVDAGELDPGNPADDSTVADTDKDGLSDGEEAKIGSNPGDADSDDDGLLDGQEPNPAVDTDKDGTINPLDADSDNDGLFDGTEAGKDCANPATDAAKKQCTADADKGVQTTRALLPDTDAGGVSDGIEDKNHDGAIQNGEADPNNPADDKSIKIDTDSDGLSDDMEKVFGSKLNDADSDDDGVRDGAEAHPDADPDGDGVINVLDADSDDDDLFDGTEVGRNCDDPSTNLAAGACIADADGGAAKTNPESNDSDQGGLLDGLEDTNKNGRIDPGEKNPNDPNDDQPKVVIPVDPGPQPAGGNGSVGGGGLACAFAAGSPPGGAGTAPCLIGLGILMLARARRRRRRLATGADRPSLTPGKFLLLALVAGAGLAAIPRAGFAQTTQVGFSLNRFQPSERGSDWFSLESLDLRGNGRFAVGLVGDYALRPLVLYDGNGDKIAGDAPIENQFNLHVGGAVILRDRVRIAASLPIALLNSGNPGVLGAQRFALDEGVAAGDLRLGADLRLLGRYGDPFTLAVGTQVHIPTGRQAAYTTDGQVRLVPRLAAAGIVRYFTYAAQISFDGRFRQKDFGGRPFGNEVAFGAAAGVRLGDGMVVIGPEFYGSTVVSDGAAFKKNATSLEVMFGGHLMIARAWRVGLGGGPGLSRAVGTPAVRLIASLAYFPAFDQTPPPDRDGDGVLDKDDACPVTPGVKTDDPTTNGCPDTDGDGIHDNHDACPLEAGVASDDPKRNGCPPPVDTDGDGIYDHNDACPREPGDPNDDPKKNGCPPPKDTDGDGIVDPVDACPLEPGVASDDPKKNGCPPPKDTDGDGIVDPVDACPLEPGVANNDPKKNGCPPDRDGDHILDKDDACPDEPGDADPDPKKNGCPKIILSEKEIKILERIEFDTNKATIRPESDPILNAIARVMKEHPEIGKVRVEGHTDDRGSAAHNTKLSQRRAESVVTWLFGRGIDKGRLLPAGFGEDRPIGENKTELGRQVNRRVQFMILEKDGKPTGN